MKYLAIATLLTGCITITRNEGVYVCRSHYSTMSGASRMTCQWDSAATPAPADQLPDAGKVMDTIIVGQEDTCQIPTCYPDMRPIAP